MGLAVLVLGESGSGKSASLRNFDKTNLVVLNVADKRFPFRHSVNTVKLRGLSYSKRYEMIKKALVGNCKKYKSFAIDDSQFLMAFGLFERVRETGFNKFNDIAVDFEGLLKFIETDLPEDVIVYLLHHTDTNDQGFTRAKTSGKMIDSQLTFEGLITVVLRTQVRDGNYLFSTRTNGFDTVKTPMGMFETEEIDNDLKLVDDTIREYYGLVSETETEVKEEKESEQ